MAKIETTLPTVQYGNVKVTFTPEELGVDVSDAAAIGVATAVYLNLFTQGFKIGSQMDVSAPVSASQEAPEHEYQSEAHRLLDERLGGVTEVPDDGADVEAKAPWEAKVDAKPKPWETEEKPAPVALTPGW